MTHKQPLLPEIPLSLFFQTVPSATTLPFTLLLAPATHWHILRRRDGVYLQQYKKLGSQPFHQLTSFPDPTLAPHKHLSITTQEHAFTVYPHGNNPITYSSDGCAYAPVTGARHFLGPASHYFKCGSLEFLLSFQEQ